MSFAEIPLPGKIFVVIATVLIAAFMVRVANTVAAEGPDMAGARERLPETKKRIEPEAIAKAAVATPAKQPVGKTKTDLVASFDRRQALVRNAVGCSAPKDHTTIAACNCVVPVLAGHITEADFANPGKKDRRFNDMVFSTMLACRKQLHLN